MPVWKSKIKVVGDQGIYTLGRMPRAAPEQCQGGMRLGGVAAGHHSHCVIIVEVRGPHRQLGNGLMMKEGLGVGEGGAISRMHARAMPTAEQWRDARARAYR